MRIAAVDIGGTRVKMGIWENQEIHDAQEYDTRAKEGGKKVIDTLKKKLYTLLPFDAIGISTTGEVNTDTGAIHYANENMPDYTGVPVREILEEEFHVPVVIENDVNAAALGEMYLGNGVGSNNFLCVTYGTGVGGGIVSDRKIYHGTTWSGGYFGGIVIHPEQLDGGKTLAGCYEKCASTTALLEAVRKVDDRILNGRQVFEQFDRPEIREVIDGWILEVVAGLVTLVHVFEPSLIVLGGGIMSQPYVISEVERRTKENVGPSFRNVQIKGAKLGNSAGMIGMAYSAQRILEQLFA